MRVDAFKEKKLEKVLIPQELLGFLKEVHEKIQNRDEDALLESDDLLQQDFDPGKGHVYGGLIEEGEGYGFSYFPEGGSRPKWEIYLTTDQLKDIYEGKTDSLDLWACQHNDCGSKWPVATESCFYCDYEEA